ncbi:MAG: hypothetical protein ACHQ2Z_08865 [Elusimicrobiota bacterium]
MNRAIPLAAALLLSGFAAAQTDFDQGTTAPKALLQELTAKAAAMPGVAGTEPPLAPEEAPIAVPTLFKGTNKDYYKPFQEAFVNAVRRLRSPEMPECAAFFQIPGEKSGEERFEAAEYRFLAMGKPHLNDKGIVTVTGAATHAEGPGPASVFINYEGPFMRQSMIVTGKSGFQTVNMGTNRYGADFGALLLLHELGHIVGKFGPDAGPNDGDLNRSYTDLVLKNCFKKDPKTPKKKKH